MTVFIREGSAAKDLESLLPAVTPRNARFFCLCTDDLQAGDLKKGGIDRVIRKAVRQGLDPVTAIRMATINPALHYRLRNRGAILPGYDADLVVIDNFNRFTVEQVIRRGRLAAKNGAVMSRIASPAPALTENTKADPPKTPFVSGDVGTGPGTELIPDQIETTAIVPAPVRHGM
jgi:adenine deaminase